MEQNNYDEMFVLPEPLFALKTEGIQFTQITSSDNGRIFLGTILNEVYEFTYQVRHINFNCITKF